MFKVNNRDTRKRCEIRSKLTIKVTERCQWAYILAYITPSVSMIDFEQVNVQGYKLVYYSIDEFITW